MNLAKVPNLREYVLSGHHPPDGGPLVLGIEASMLGRELTCTEGGRGDLDDSLC